MYELNIHSTGWRARGRVFVAVGDVAEKRIQYKYSFLISYAKAFPFMKIQSGVGVDVVLVAVACRTRDRQKASLLVVYW